MHISACPLLFDIMSSFFCVVLLDLIALLLHLPHLRVSGSWGSKEARVGSRFNDAPLVHNQDTISVLREKEKNDEVTALRVNAEVEQNTMCSGGKR